MELIVRHVQKNLSESRPSLLSTPKPHLLLRTYRLQFLTFVVGAKLFMQLKRIKFTILTRPIGLKGVPAGLSTEDEDMGLGTDNSEAGLRTDEAIAPFLATVSLFAQFKIYRPARTEMFDYFFFVNINQWQIQDHSFYAPLTCPECEDNYRPQRSCGKVIFLHVSVILSTGGGLPLVPGRSAPGPGGGSAPGQTHIPSLWVDTIPRADIPLGRHRTRHRFPHICLLHSKNRQVIEFFHNSRLIRRIQQNIIYKKKSEA